MLGVGARRHAALPALEFDVHVTEPTGRQVYVIALSAQIMIEPARRQYTRCGARAARRAVRPAGALGDHDAQPGLAPRRRARAQLHRRDHLHGPVPCTFDLEIAAAKYFNAVEDGLVPLAFNFNGIDPLPRRRRAAADVAGPVELLGGVPLRRRGLAPGDGRLLPERALGALHAETLHALLAEKARRGAPTMDAAIAGLLRDAGA